MMMWWSAMPRAELVPSQLGVEWSIVMGKSNTSQGC